MKRIAAALRQRFREFTATQRYYDCLRRTEELYKQRSFINAELRKALADETVAQERRKKIIESKY